MTKFASIWGDLTVGKVEPAPDKPKDTPAAAAPTPPEPDEPEVPKPVEPVEVVPSPIEVPVPPEPLEFKDEEIERTYNMLIDEGVLPEPEDGSEGFDISPAGLADAVAAVTRKKLQEEISAIPESVQQFYAHVMEGKDPGSFELQTPIIWDEVNLDDESNQEQALMQFYVNQGMTSEEAREEVDDVKVAGKLEKKADVAREALVKVQAANISAKNAREAEATAAKQQEVDDEVEELKKTIDSSKSIAGFDLNDKKKSQFKDYLFKVKPRTGKTQMQENMSSEDRRMNIAFLDFVDYTKADLKKEVQSDMTKKRKKRLTRYSDKGVRGSNSSKSVTTKTDVNKGKIVFPSIFGNQSVDIED